MTNAQLGEQPSGHDTCASETACPPARLLLIACLAIGLGVVTNRWLNAHSDENYIGEVQVETILVRAPVDGILQSWQVNEGDVIDPEVLLCQIGGHNMTRQIQIQEQEVERLQARLKTLRADLEVKLHQNLRELDGDIYAAELQTAELLQKKYYYEIEAMAWQDTHDQQLEQKVASLEEAPGLQRQESEVLTTEQINAMLKEEAALNSAEATKAQLELCSQRLQKLKEQKKALQERMKEAVGVLEVELELAQAQEELTYLRRHLEQQNVRSTALGTVANVRKRAGEYVQAGEVLVEMFEMHESYVVADIPTSMSHRFQLETPVKCRFPNGETRTGVVTKVALAANTKKAGEKYSPPTVPLRIEPTGALWPQMPVGGHITIVR